MRSKSLTYSFVTNLIFLIAINLVIKPVWVFVVDRNVQLQLGFEQYGVYYALLNITYLFGVVLDLGLTNFHQREVSKNENTFGKLFANIFSAKWLLSVLYALVCVGFAWLWHYDLQKIQWLLWLLASQILASFILFFRSNLSALQHYFIDSLLSVTDKALMIIFIGWFLFFDKQNFSLYTFIQGQFVAYAITFLLALIAVLRYKKPMNRPALVELKTIIADARPFTMLILWMTIYFRLDSVLVERLSMHQPQQESGIYAAAYRLLDMINNFAFLFSMLLYPMFSKLIAEKKSLQPLLKLSSPFLLSIAWIVCCSMFFGKMEWLNLLYHRQDVYSANVMLIVLCGFFGVSLQYIYSTAVTAAGKLKWQNKAAASAVFFNAISNLIFIPKYGAMAAAINALITLTGMGIVNYFFAKKLFALSINSKLLLRWMFWLGFVVVVFYCTKFLKISFFYQELFCVFLSLLMGWIGEIIPVKTFMNLLKNQDFEIK